MFLSQTRIAAAFLAAQLLTVSVPVLAKDASQSPTPASLMEAPKQQTETFDSTVFVNTTSRPLSARLTTAIDAKTAHEGDRFEARLDKPYLYNNQMLPENTLFTGKIHKIQESQPFGRSGYVVLDVENAQLPNGLVFVLDKNRYSVQDKPVRKTRTSTKVLTTAGSMAVGLGTSLPLRLVTDLSTFIVTPIAMGSRAIYNSAVELGKDDQRPAGKKIAYGVFKGTGIPSVYHFVNPTDVKLATGDRVDLYMDPNALQALFAFSASNEQQARQSTPNDPTILLEHEELPAPEQAPLLPIEESK